jgi:hypothetical protein
VRVPYFDLCDDLPSYFHFPRLLLESGGFIEPFNFRRLSALGAAQFAQSLFWKDFTVAANGVADAVLGQLLLWAAVRKIPSAVSSREQPAWIGEVLALAALVAAFAIPPWNATPKVLPVAGTVVLLLLTLRLSRADGAASDMRSAMAWGLISAWLIGIRISNVPLPATLWIVGVLVAVYRRDLRQGRLLAVAALSTGLGLLPWSLALWQSSGTPLFPLIDGNFRLPGLSHAPLDPTGVLSAVGNGLWTSRVWVVAALGVLAAMRPGIRILSFQTVAAISILVAATTAASTGFEPFAAYRYCAPLVVGSLTFLAAAVLAQRGGALVLCALVLLVATWLLVPVTFESGSGNTKVQSMETITHHIRKRAYLVAWVFSSPRSPGLEIPEYRGRDSYEHAQSVLPSDARLVSAVEKPFFFRFDRQVIHTLDFPGATSPDPGMPSFSGPEALARYFVELGYTHLVSTPPRAASCLYSDRFWTMDRNSDLPYRRRLAPYMLDFLGNAAKLKESRAVLFETPGLVVIDLRHSSG